MSRAVTDARLISDLTKDFKKVERIARPERFFYKWIAASTLLVLAEFVFTGGMRTTFWYQMRHSFYYAAETAVSIAVFVVSGLVVLLRSVPDTRYNKFLTWLPIGLYGLFFAMVLAENAHPVYAPVEVHHYFLCEAEALLFGVLPAFFLYRFVRKAAPTQPNYSGVLIVLASMGLPISFLQAWCMYSPTHVLFHHVIPLGMIAGIGAVWGAKHLVWD